VLRVHVLGPMEVDAGGTAIVADRRRTWSLLGWLALHPGPHARGDLAARFWPDVLDSSARASLRSAVWTLRRDLGPAAGR
jgi:DNA-binding SARP family transcriptional activator